MHPDVLFKLLILTNLEVSTVLVLGATHSRGSSPAWPPSRSVALPGLCRELCGDPIAGINSDWPRWAGPAAGFCETHGLFVRSLRLAVSEKTAVSSPKLCPCQYATSKAQVLDLFCKTEPWDWARGNVLVQRKKPCSRGTENRGFSQSQRGRANSGSRR